MTSHTPRRPSPSSSGPVPAALALLGLGALAVWLEPGLQAAALDVMNGTLPTPAPQGAIPGSGALLDGFKLLLAATIGSVITAVQHHTRKDLPLTRSMAQSYVLLCVAGALTMTMIGESLPRAFAVGGAASIVRFRTPVEDPRDGTALFLLMGLGMACGVGAFSVAIIGTLFLACCLIVLSRQSIGAMSRSMRVAVISDGATLPVAHITQVFSNYQIHAEPFEISHGEQTIIRYKAVLQGDRRLDEVTQELLDGGTNGIKSVSWETPKKWI